jgi:hypothetical protein
MRLSPVTKETILQLVAATLAPIVPLALTMMPPEELLKTLLRVLFQDTASGLKDDVSRSRREHHPGQ